MKILTVSQLNRAVNDYLEQGLGVVAVQGEVSQFRSTNQKLVFFTLKDKTPVSRVLACNGKSNTH